MEHLNVSDLLNHPQAMIVPALMFLGYLLKSSGLAGRWIPWTLAAAGMALGYVFVAHSWNGVVAGFLYASVSVMSHQAYKQSRKED